MKPQRKTAKVKCPTCPNLIEIGGKTFVTCGYCNTPMEIFRNQGAIFAEALSSEQVKERIEEIIMTQ
jgi:hypothetical protein